MIHDDDNEKDDIAISEFFFLILYHFTEPWKTTIYENQI